jgi:2-methylisocitrate lyase-like PEP mutase family enzyme
MIQAEKINTFKALHKKGDPLVLVNIWDVGSAKAVADAGAPAIATASWSSAAANGFTDAESLPMDLALANAERIVAAVDLPVSLDFEGGYATKPDEVARNVATASQTGIVGINLEDRRPDEAQPLPLDIATARVAAARDASPIFINARLDAFLVSDAVQHAALLDEAIARAQSYVASGADGIFVPGLADLDLLAKFCAACPAPVNAYTLDPTTGATALAGAGAGRVSSGPGPYRAVMAQLGETARQVYSS